MFDELDKTAFVMLGIAVTYIVIAVNWNDIMNFLGI